MQEDHMWKKFTKLWLGDADLLTINLVMTVGANISPLWCLLSCRTQLEPLLARENPKEMLAQI